MITGRQRHKPVYFDLTFPELSLRYHQIHLYHDVAGFFWLSVKNTSLNFVKQHRMTVVIRVAGRSATYVFMNSFCEEEILLCKQIRLQRNFEILRKIVTFAFEQRKGLP